MCSRQALPTELYLKPKILQLDTKKGVGSDLSIWKKKKSEHYEKKCALSLFHQDPVETAHGLLLTQGLDYRNHYSWRVTKVFLMFCASTQLLSIWQPNI